MTRAKYRKPRKGTRAQQVACPICHQPKGQPCHYILWPNDVAVNEHAERYALADRTHHD